LPIELPARHDAHESEPFAWTTPTSPHDRTGRSRRRRVTTAPSRSSRC